MKRQSATPRSFLRQLAEPIPRAAAPLFARRPAAERAAATRSSLDSIPPIIDVTGTKDTLPAESQPAQAASSVVRRSPPRRAKTGAQSESSQVNTTANTPAVDAQPAKHSLANAAETIFESTMPGDTGTPTKTPPAETQENAHLQSVLAHSVSAQANSPFSPAPRGTAAKTEKRPDISVHIGTIEVRVPAPPARTPQPAPAALNPRNTQHGVPSRAAEPLTRSLAWSHGLVQG